MTEKITLYLSTAQKNKLSKGQTFQLSNQQLQAGEGKHMVEIELPSKEYQKLVKNVSLQKGYRFTPNVVVGHGFFGNIAKSVLKSVAPTVIDYVGDKTKTRGLTDAIVKPIANNVIDLGVNQVSGGRLMKGSPEMKERMAMLRGMRKGAGHKMKMDMGMDMVGGNVFDDIRNGFNRTFTPALGKDIQKSLTSPIAKNVYKTVADASLGALGTATGTPILSGIASQGINALIDGANIRRRKSNKNMMIQGSSLINGVPPSIQMNHIMNPVPIRDIGGGSFLSAGGSFLSPGQSRGGTLLLRKGKGFRGRGGTLYGGDSLIV
jgi:hypothetical protein